MEEPKELVQKSEAALREERILAFWRDNNTFQKSLEKVSPKGNYVFYDGPPFATGQIHYGHILGSTAKDAIGRYQTMRGHHVPRRWGWDCHGLPIENIVEKELGIAGHKEIEAYGVEKFVEYARSKVLQYDKDWERGVERIGRWVDFRGGYKTMDNTFIESVWWALGQLQTKGLIYEGVRVLAYCSRCETPIANSEIAMDNSYKDITDISVYVKFEMIESPATPEASQGTPTYLLAWTTTPWTLPGNFALAANPEFNYVKIKIGEAFYILGKERLSVIKDAYEIVEENVTIIGKSYKPIFDYFLDKEIENKGNAWKVYAAAYVTNDAGTGIVHIAPGYGEEDMELAKRENIPFMHHVLNDGTFAEAVRDFIGLSVKPKSDEKDGHQKTDIEIIKHLAHGGHLFAKEKIVHSYPHCMRCDTPIIYYALPSWFVNIQKVKPEIIENAKDMNWIPSHLKDGRFKNNLEGAPDWTISRNRYWATPLPFWKSPEGKLMTASSLEDLKIKSKTSGNKYFAMRHGYGQHMDAGVVSGLDHDSYHLTEDGRKGILAQAEALKKDGITKIIASPLIRTQETAKMAAEILGVPVESIITDVRLREYDFGEFDGKPWQEYVAYRKEHITEYDQKLGGSSLLETKNRFGEFMYELESKYANEKILIVTHGIFFETVASVVVGADNKKSLEILFTQFTGNRIQPAEIREIPFVPIPHNHNYELDLHRPYIDSIKLTDEAGTIYERIPEVIDCWFESGSMPFAQDHYPFERPNWKEENFPAGFVAEYIAQTRTWFYYTHAVSTMLFGAAPFKNVVTTGTLRAEDGQKISKSKKNYPDPWIFIDKYGVDPLRLYLMSGPLMKGEDANFSEKTVAEIANKIIGRLGNVLSFYELYRDTVLEQESFSNPTNVLDIWIMSRLNQLVSEVTEGMEAYDMAEATRPFDLFVDDLSTWYLRRSRDRMKDGETEAKQTLYTVLKTVATVLAPFAPFTAEDMWLKLKTEADVESVHLTAWPTSNQVEEYIVENMQRTRALVSLGLEARQKNKIVVRQPLAKISIKLKDFKDFALTGDYLQIISQELNVKEVELLLADEGEEAALELDTVITPELKLEGNYRELVRAIQELRKTEGLNPSDHITVSFSKDAEGLVAPFMKDFMKTVQAKEVWFEGDGGEELKIADATYLVKIAKI